MMLIAGSLLLSALLLHRRRFSLLFALHSLLLRALSYIFLRVVPAFWGPRLAPVFFVSFAVGWWVVDQRLDGVEREMGKGGGGVFQKQRERLEEWQRVERDGRVERDEEGRVVMPKVEVGEEVVQAARERQTHEDGNVGDTEVHETAEEKEVLEGAEEKEAHEAAEAKAPTSPGKLSYAAVAAAPPPSPPPSSSKPSSPSSQMTSPQMTSPDPTRPPIKPSTAPPITTQSLHRSLLPSQTRTFPLPLSLALGFPSRSRLTNRLTLLLNLVLLLFCLDFSFRSLLPLPSSQVPSLAFARVAATGESWVKVSARVPPWKVPLARRIGGEVVGAVRRATGDGEEERGPEEVLGARVIYRPTQPVGKWLVGPLLDVSARSDWMGVARIENLFPGTEYEYRLVLPDAPATHHPMFPEVGYFKTFPDHRLSTSSVFTFGTTSCIKAGFPYNLLKGPLNNPGADILAKHLDTNPLDFFLFLGDFVYVDNPWYSGPKVKHYHRLYRQTYANPSWRRVSRSTPVFHIYDDHEIFNDWSGHADEGEDNAVYGAANKAYRDYHGLANYDGPGNGENYYWFRHGDAAFFVWDTRRYRSHNFAEDGEGKTILGEKQKQVFFDWLRAVNSTVTFKFVVSSVPLMTLWHSSYVDASDTWAGFLHERSELLSEMQYVPNLVVLSGDRHEFAAATIRDSVLELSTSPLNQFWLPAYSLRKGNSLGGVEDHLIKYAPEGRHKFTTISVDTRTANSPKLAIKLWKDGHETWNLTYVGRPVRRPPQQISNLMPTLAEWLGLKPSRWFRPYTVNEDIS